MKSFFKEFRDFVADGNIMDMAIAFIMGGAFQTLLTALVDDIFMPIIGIFTGSISFTEFVFHIGPAQIKMGSFISSTITFLLTAFVIFLMIKSMNKARQLATGKNPEDEEADPTELEVLQSILEQLEQQNTPTSNKQTTSQQNLEK
ncbi:large conductance mechanosensitive channel protein MscL [Weissella minor]|uniref:large conductance mechanosensitive channel protein MscL n=1 Tax=Weissella minor TaxID=1620 RepID=UPI001BAE9045|nr:large conductance mechanosensitive channel protein MscL [Weissella minor]MBS0949979.1 large conductance mechanosensitive channel protein MscL [Weissella minor]